MLIAIPLPRIIQIYGDKKSEQIAVVEASDPARDPVFLSVRARARAK
jgi:hypothetical protein